MSDPGNFSSEEARRIGDSLGIDWERVDLEQFRLGLLAEHEYVTKVPDADAANDGMGLAGKIALAYLQEHPNYYARLATAEAEADKLSTGKIEFAP
jgi:hypothetical protein